MLTSRKAVRYQVTVIRQVPVRHISSGGQGTDVTSGAVISSYRQYRYVDVRCQDVSITASSGQVRIIRRQMSGQQDAVRPTMSGRRRCIAWYQRSDSQDGPGNPYRSGGQVAWYVRNNSNRRQTSDIRPARCQQHMSDVTFVNIRIAGQVIIRNVRRSYVRVVRSGLPSGVIRHIVGTIVHAISGGQ
jgi:hypothetical protein